MKKSICLGNILQRDGNNFDVLRLIAAIGVIIGHAYAIAPDPNLQDGILSIIGFDYSGSLAVKFFFFLSGLLVTNSILRNSNPFLFILKRSFRIFPGLLLCLAFSVFIIGPFFTTLPIISYFKNKDTWAYLFNNLCLFNLKWRLTGVFEQSKYGLNGSLWTLPYEVVCYIWLAVIYGIGVMKNKIVSNLFFALVILICFINPNSLPSFFSQNPEAHLLPACFALGGLFANNKDYIPIGIAPSLLLCLLLFLLKGTILFQSLFYITLFYTTIYISSTSFVKKYLTLPFDASYGIYLYGFIVQQCLKALFPDIGLHSHQLIASLVALLLGIASWYLIEKRFIVYGNKYINNEEWSKFKKIFLRN